jgi:serine/threonine-protein kinase
MAETILDYDVVQRLGEGAHSVIYAVSDRRGGQIYALKHVLRVEADDFRFLEQVQNEFDVSRRSIELKLVKSLMRKVNEAFLVMEFFDGEPIGARKPATMEQMIDTFLQTARGLRALHELGCVHCDINPGNILRNDQGQVKIIDFGQSCRVGAVKQRIQGSLDYIAPEQIDLKAITAKTDIFNLGATFYFLLTGQHVPTLHTHVDGYHTHTHIDRPMDLNPQISAPLSNLVMECIAIEPEQRPADMAKVAARVELAEFVHRKEGQTPVPANFDP